MSAADPAVEEDPGLAADREAVASHLAKALSAVTGRFGSELDSLEAAQDSLSAKLAAAGAGKPRLPCGGRERGRESASRESIADVCAQIVHLPRSVGCGERGARRRWAR